MADESKSDADPWDEPDWVGGKGRAGEPRPRRRWPLVMAAVGALLVVAVVVAVWQVRLEQQRRARQAEEYAVEAAREVERARQAEEAEREAAQLRLKALLAEETPPEAPHDPVAAMLAAAAGDPAALNRFGQFLLSTDDVDRAVEAIREAARLDPQYADSLAAALKRQAEFHHTAPPPREVVRP